MHAELREWQEMRGRFEMEAAAMTSAMAAMAARTSSASGCLDGVDDDSSRWVDLKSAGVIHQVCDTLQGAYDHTTQQLVTNE